MPKSPEQFKPYTMEEAESEASKMQEKIKSGKVENYNKAEEAVDEERMLENKIKEIWEKEATQAENNEVYSSAARDYEKAGNTSKAMEMWKKDIERGESKKDWYEPKPIAYIRVGDELHASGNESRAKEMWNKAAKLMEEERDYAGATETYEKMSDVIESREVWKRAAKNAEDMKSYDIAAEYYEKAENESKAEEMWGKEAKKREKHIKSPSHVSIPQRMIDAAEAYEKAGDIPNAFELWEKVAKEYGKEYGGKHRLASLACEKLSEFYEEWGEEMKHLAEMDEFEDQREWARRHNKSAEARIRSGDYFNAAWDYEEMGNITGAIEMYEKASKQIEQQDPNNVSYGHYSAIAQCYEKILELKRKA